MMSIKPDAYYASVLDIDPQALVTKGYKAVLLDLDNTLLPRGASKLGPSMIAWVAELKAVGLSVALLSNNSGSRAPEAAEPLDIPVIGSAFKPLKGGFLRACAALGVAPKDALMIGDQSYTDVLGAHRLGMDAYMVMPLNQGDPVHTRILRRIDGFAVKGMPVQVRSL